MALCILMNRKSVLFIKMSMDHIQSNLIWIGFIIGQNYLKKSSLSEFGVENTGCHLKKCKLYCAYQDG